MAREGKSSCSYMAPTKTLCIGFLLLTQLLTIRADFVFKSNSLDEGDPCLLKDGSFGQCRRGSKCSQYFSLTNRCGFVGLEPVLCCDVLRKQCESLSLVGSSQLPFVDHIVGDVDRADLGEFPFMALLTYSNPSFRCGASLVSDKFLLTAAHCIRNKEKLKPEFVKLGTSEADDPEATTIRIKQTFVHENYTPKYKQNDVALVELETAVNRSWMIKPICLHVNQDDLSDQDELKIIGWGVKNEERDLSNQLLKGTVRPISKEVCEQRFRQAPNGGSVRLTEQHLCALGEETTDRIATDACQGDSGGPLVFTKEGRHYLTGITSTGAGCGSVHFAGVYTRVNRYLQWIIAKGVFDGY